jgi:hypothetical protein
MGEQIESPALRPWGAQRDSSRSHRKMQAVVIFAVQMA